MPEETKYGDFIREKGPDVVDKLGSAADVIVEQAEIALEQIKGATIEAREKISVKFAEAARAAAERADKAAAEAQAQAAAAAKAAEVAHAAAAAEAVTVEVEEAVDAD